MNIRSARRRAMVSGDHRVIRAGRIQQRLKHRRELSSQSRGHFRPLRLPRISSGDGALDVIVYSDIQQLIGFPSGVIQHSADDDRQHREAGNQANLGRTTRTIH